MDLTPSHSLRLGMHSKDCLSIVSAVVYIQSHVWTRPQRRKFVKEHYQTPYEDAVYVAVTWCVPCKEQPYCFYARELQQHFSKTRNCEGVKRQGMKTKHTI